MPASTNKEYTQDVLSLIHCLFAQIYIQLVALSERKAEAEALT